METEANTPTSTIVQPGPHPAIQKDENPPGPVTAPPVEAMDTKNDERKKQEKVEEALQNEVKSGRHYFEVKHRSSKMSFKWPTVEEKTKAEWHYSKMYHQAIEERLMFED